MTNEELEKKAEEYSVIDFPNDEFYQAIVKKSYITGAKEMQKELIEIERVSDYRWEENQQLKQENEQLKQKIEKMHNCENCKHFKFNGFHQQNECSKYSCEWELAE